MPSKKKKKAKGKGRAAAKSSRDKGLKDDNAGSDVKPDVKNVELRMQRLQINNNDQDDETALLEEAINLAATEREQLETAAKNDEENNAERCDHGFSPLPRGHICTGFVRAFVRDFSASNKNRTIDRLDDACKASQKYSAVWHDPDLLEHVMSHFLAEGTNMLLRGQDKVARQSGMFLIFFEIWRDSMTSGGTPDFRSYVKISELSRDTCDEHTFVSFFRKRIPCKCLDKRYKEVKSIVKMGHCNNPDCPLPDRQTELSKLMNCEQCRAVFYCSTECQKAAWPSHKKNCVEISQLR